MKKAIIVPKHVQLVLIIAFVGISFTGFSQETTADKKDRKWKGMAHIGVYGGVNLSNYRVPAGSNKQTDIIVRPSVGFVGGIGTKGGFCIDIVDIGVIGYGSKSPTGLRMNTTHINTGIARMGYRFRFNKDKSAPGIELSFCPMNWLLAFNSKTVNSDGDRSPIGFGPKKERGLTILHYAFDMQLRFVLTKWMSIDVRRTWAVLKANRTNYWFGSNMYNRGWQLHLFFGLN